MCAVSLIYTPSGIVRAENGTIDGLVSVLYPYTQFKQAYLIPLSPSGWKKAEGGHDQ
jgi:hypothetical protein